MVFKDVVLSETPSSPASSSSSKDILSRVESVSRRYPRIDTWLFEKLVTSRSEKAHLKDLLADKGLDKGSWWSSVKQYWPSRSGSRTSNRVSIRAGNLSSHFHSTSNESSQLNKSEHTPPEAQETSAIQAALRTNLSPDDDDQHNAELGAPVLNDFNTSLTPLETPKLTVQKPGEVQASPMHLQLANSHELPKAGDSGLRRKSLDLRRWGLTENDILEHHTSGTEGNAEKNLQVNHLIVPRPRSGSVRSANASLASPVNSLDECAPRKDSAVSVAPDMSLHHPPSPPATTRSNTPDSR
jgi:hypothetical protein